MLTFGVWIGDYIDMPGLSTNAREIFGSDIRLILQKNGRCSLEISGRLLKAKWTMKGRTIHIRGKGIDTKGDLDPTHIPASGFYPQLRLYNIENYMVIFRSESHR